MRIHFSLSNSNTKIQITKWLVISSIFFSLFSVYMDKMGWGLPYPFQSWKLYTQPYGWENTASQYRIYARKSGDESFARMPVKETQLFTTDEYVYIFRSLVSKSLEGNEESMKESKAKLLTYVRHLEPDFVQYKIVKETFVPTELLSNTHKYDTCTVLILN